MNKKIDPKDRVITLRINSNDYYKLQKLMEISNSDKSKVVRDAINEAYKQAFNLTHDN